MLNNTFWCWAPLACEAQTYFRSSLLSLRKGGREATTGNTSALRRLEHHKWEQNLQFLFLSYNQGHSTWVTLLWYLSFSLPMLFCKCFFCRLVQFWGQLWKGEWKGGQAQHVNVVPSIDPSSNVTDWRQRVTLSLLHGILLSRLWSPWNARNFSLSPNSTYASS